MYKKFTNEMKYHMIITLKVKVKSLFFDGKMTHGFVHNFYKCNIFLFSKCHFFYWTVLETVTIENSPRRGKWLVIGCRLVKNYFKTAFFSFHTTITKQPTFKSTIYYRA